MALSPSFSSPARSAAAHAPAPSAQLHVQQSVQQPPSLPHSSSLPHSPSRDDQSASTTQCMVGNDRLDPTRLTLNNGINHGDYIIGPPVQPVNGTPVRNISEYIAKREGTDDFVVLKVLTLSEEHSDRANDEQGRMLLYNELSILSLLQDQPGVVHQHGFFRDKNRFILVLDCLVGHEYDKEGRYQSYENLQHYVIREKRLSEKEALEVFTSALTTVEALHKKNIVHRDLKLGNMILNKRTREVTLTNFVLSKHLVRDGDELMDQRGSLAYVSPDVLSGLPYCGKASDMWAMGVLLYTMIYGQFPFYDNDPQELFRKIKTAKYTIPRDDRVSMVTVVLIKEMMEVDTKRRITARRALDTALSILNRVVVSPENDAAAQIVPDMEDKQHRSDIAMAMKTEGLPSSSSHSTLTGTGTALRRIHSDSHSTHVPSPVHPVAASLAFQGSPIHIATSPVHTGPIPFQGSPVHFTTSPVHAGSISFHTSSLNASSGPQLILNSDLSSAYLLTPLTPSLSPANSSAFFTAHSPPSTTTFLSASPTHSLDSSSNSPVNLSTSPTSSSLPLHRHHHRPVGPSQSVDSYFTSLPQAPPPTTNPSPSSSLHVRPTALLSSGTHSHSIVLPSVSESGRDISPAGSGLGAFVTSSPVESMVTMVASPRDDSDRNRHSFTSVDAAFAASLSQAGPRGHTHPRRRRNSSGDLNNTRVRRSSQGCHAQSPSASMETASLASALHQGRVRRRSHDHHMEGRSRTSRSASREPYSLNPQ